MKDAITKRKYGKVIESCINTYCLLMNSCDDDRLFRMLSPNMRKLVNVEKNIEKYEKVLIFGRKIIGQHVYELIETDPGTLNGIVWISLVPEGLEETQTTFEYNDLHYRVYKFRFIDIDDHFYIDDACLYNEFWSDYKDELKNLVDE